MSPKFFISIFIFALFVNIASSQPAENILRIDASMIEEMSKMVLSQFSSILSPKNVAKITGLNPSSSSSKMMTSTAAPSTVTEKIRQCTCSESDECIAEAYRFNSFCLRTCKSHLEYYSTNPEEFLACFPKNPSGHFMINKCLKENIPQFCASADSESSRVSYIPKPIYNNNQSATTFEFNFDLGKHVLDMVVLEHLKTFFACSGACMKEKIVACFQRKSCGVHLPKNYDLANIAQFCPALKSSINSNLMKALPCFAMQQVLPKFFN
uniref:Uncharacterized protein n=1 Tax=Panagrolaimus sp. ES5 TaxID=591445 RepID=A0AC34F1H3_9BILA